MAQHQSFWCRWSGDRTVGTNNQNYGSGDQTIDDHHWSSISSDWIANTSPQNDVIGYRTFEIGCGAASLAIANTNH